MKEALKIGILSFQGSVAEHEEMLRRLGVAPVLVRTPMELDQVDGLILPGGESTTIGKLLRIFGLMNPLKERIVQGMPVWGTCAGMILLAKKIVGESPYLDVMDITVRRNAYGRQIDSFTSAAVIPAISQEAIELVFIRAPWIEQVGEKAEALLNVDGHVVAARQENMLVTSFHPELTQDTSVHAYFLAMCAK